MRRVSVILPAYNEAGAVGATVAEIRAVLASLPELETEILVVDDGSRDPTADEARAAGATVISHPHNVGYGRSLKDGISAASHDTIVICDADGSYPTEEIPRLLAEYERGFNMVVGARKKAELRDPFFKVLMRGVLKGLVEFTAGRHIPDVNSGLRVFAKREVEPYFRHLSNTFSFTTSLTLAYLMSHKFVSYLPIPYRPRVGTTKVRLLRDSLRTLQYISQAILIYNPIKLFLALALGTLLFGLLSTGAALLLKAPAAALLTAVASVLTAVLVVACGFLADLARMVWRGDP